MSLALVVLIGMYVMTGCKLSESPFLVQYTMYEINYRLTGELPDTNEVWSNYLDMTKSQAGVPLVAITGAWDLGSFCKTHTLQSRVSNWWEGSRRMLLRRGGERSSGHVRYDRGAPTYL